MLNEREVAGILTMEETLDAVEDAFREKAFGRVQMPPKVYVTINKYNGDFRSMPSYFEKREIAGIKVVNVHVNNLKLYNKPTVMATIILIDPKSGAPISIMSGTYITAMRTGAAGGIATKYLASKNSTVLGLVGTGAQARTQLSAISKILNLKEIRAYDKSKESLNKFIKEVEKQYPIRVSLCKNIEECVKNSDVVSTLTPSASPIIKNGWINNGTHINAIGADAPGKQEVDPLILKKAKIIVDDLEQCIHSGEINIPLSNGILKKEDVYAELGEVIIGNKPGRVRDDEITIFDSTGLSIQDISTAARVFTKARVKKIGKWITI